MKKAIRDRMTTYTTTAIATNSVTNTVTVASISNMYPGLPITFSGTTFGGITTDSTYYIGTIIYGYPTSTITLTSLPGGAIFALTTATGSMVATWESGGQQIISTVPPGENLNTAFTKINTNFDQLWAAGPVNSNIKISENTIYTLDTNGDLILNPNGIGNVVANAHIVPDTTLIRNLGAPTKVWNEIYVAYAEVGNITISQLTIPVANLHILGGANHDILSTDGDGNLSWIEQAALAGGANNTVQYNNNGILNGSSSFSFNSSSNTVTMGNLVTTGRANLNSVSNVVITGGDAGYVLYTDGLGGLSWGAPLGNTQVILDQQLAGDGSTTTFTLITPAFTNSVLVAINGVQQIPDVAYEVVYDQLTFTQAPAVSDYIDVRFLVGGPTGNGQPGGSNGTIQFNNGSGFGGSGNLKYFESTGNLFSSNLSVSGNITSSYYYGNGRYITGVISTANTGTITFSNNIISTSDSGNAINVLGPQSTSVGLATGGNTATSQLLWATNISALTPDQLPNAISNGNSWGSQISAGNIGVTVSSNSASGLKTWTFGTNGTFSGVGGVIAGNITSTTDITANANVSAVGNVSGTYILGNISFATGIPQSYGNSNVYALLNGSAANIIPLANVGYSLGNATNQWKDIWVSNSTIYMNSVPITIAAGNTLTVNGNAVVTTNGNGVTTFGNIGFVGEAIYDLNGIYLENADLTHGATAALLLPSNGNSSVPISLNNIYGNILLQTGVASDITAAWSFDNAGNLNLPNNAQLSSTVDLGINKPGGGINLLSNAYVQLQYSGDYANASPYSAANSNWAFVDASGFYITNNISNTFSTWQFDNSGNLTLPDTATASINYANGLPYGGGGSTNTGNIQFSGNNIYNFQGNTQGILISSNQGGGSDGEIYLPYLDQNSALTITNNSGAGATIDLILDTSTWQFDISGNLTLPDVTDPRINYANGNPYSVGSNAITNGTSSVSIPTSNGNVVIGLSGSDAFTFGTDGNLTFRNGAKITEALSPVPGNYALALYGTGAISEDQRLLVYPTSIDANHLHLTSGNLYNTELFLGNDALYVKLANTGNVVVNTDDGNGNTAQWNFGTNGNLTLPGNTSSINYANGQPYGGTGGNPFNQNLNTTDSVTFAGVSSTGNIITSGTGGDITMTSGNITGVNYITGNFFVGDGGQLTNVVANTSNITFNNSTIVGPSFGTVPSANSSIYIQPTIDSANVFQFGADGNITASGNLGLVTNSNLWTFDTNGTLTLPGNTLQLGLVGGNSGLNSINDANITVNASGNVWNFDTAGKLTLPAQNVSGSAGESQLLTGSRRIINGVYTGATNPYAVELNIGPTPTVAYTASDSVYSVKVTFAVQGTGVGFNWEQFDVVATWSQDVAGAVNFVVSNRIKSTASVPDTVVTATINGTNQIEISLALTSGQNGWASFDAVEFGLMVD